MPYLIGRSEEVEKAFYLRQWDVPFEALAYVFGRDAMYWYRAWLAFGRPNLVGTTVKTADLDGAAGCCEYCQDQYRDCE